MPSSKTKATPPKGDHAISMIEPAMAVCLAMLVIMSILYAPDGCQKRAGQGLPSIFPPTQPPPPYDAPSWRYEDCPQPQPGIKRKFA